MPDRSILPEEWEMIRLGYLSDTYPSGVDKKVEEDEVEVELCNYTDVYHNDFIVPGQEFMTATATTRERERFELRAGDVLLTKDSEDWQDIGVPALVKEDLPGVLCGYHLFLSRPDTLQIVPRYLFWALKSKFVGFQFEGAATGVTRFGLTTGDVRSAWIPVPDMGAQERIASFLDHHTTRIDRLIKKKERLLGLLEEKRQSVITRFVTRGLDRRPHMEPTEVPYLEGVPSSWRLIPLKYLVEIQGGKTPPKEEERYWDGEIPWFTPKDMKEDRLQSSKEHITDAAIDETGISKVPEGSVLVVVRGMILDHTFPVAVTERPGTINQDMKAISPDGRVSSEYLMRTLQGLSPAILALVGESAHGTKKLDSDILRDFELPVPPQEIQSDIVNALDAKLAKIAELTERTSDTVDLLKEERQALITAAVTGQIDVTDWEPPEGEEPIAKSAEAVTT